MCICALVQKKDIRLCIPVDVDADWISSCNEVMAGANTDTFSFSCAPGGSPNECVRMIRNGEAEIVNLGASDMPPAVENGLEPVVAEFYGVEGFASYFAVAVVKSGFCSPGISFNDLKGKRSCHTGFRKTSGWNIPVGYLAATGVLPIQSVNPLVANDAESVAAFFSETCAPRVTSDGPGVGGTKWSGLCTACSGDCSESDPFYDYAGTARGLMSGACDVAFTKETIAPMYAADGSAPEDWSTLDKEQMRLLCPDGGCAAIEDYQNCNLGRVPAHAIFASSQNSEISALKDALVLAGNSPGFLNSATELNGVENMPFKQGTQALLRIDLPFDEFYDKKVLDAFNQVRKLE